MKRTALLLALFAAGCDDESLPAKVANAQLHGIVAAQADCYCTLSGPSAYTFSARYQKLMDGSCFAMAPGSGGPTLGAEHCESGSPDFDIYDGLIHGPEGYSDADITTCCTGFNLAAFGVE